METPTGTKSLLEIIGKEMLEEGAFHEEGRRVVSAHEADPMRNVPGYGPLHRQPEKYGIQTNYSF